MFWILYLVLPSLTGFLSNLIRFCLVVLGFYWDYRVLLGFLDPLSSYTEFYWVFWIIYLVLPILTGFFSDVIRFYIVLLGFYLVVPSFG